MSGSSSRTSTYSAVDVDNVVRRFRADLMMIVDSSKAMTVSEAEDYLHDIGILARGGYLRWVDVTLLASGIEIRATKYEVDTDAGELVCSRPGGVLWPNVASGRLRIVISHASTYDADAESKTKGRLRKNWTDNLEDISHSGLKAGGGRDYSSNSYGMKRKDWE